MLLGLIDRVTIGDEVGKMWQEEILAFRLYYNSIQEDELEKTITNTYE
jgi:hypothetical protein